MRARTRASSTRAEPVKRTSISFTFALPEAAADGRGTEPALLGSGGSSTEFPAGLSAGTPEGGSGASAGACATARVTAASTL